MSDEKYGSKWSEDETVLAYYYYCLIPFGKIHHNNPEIIRIANVLGRTPGSVSFKMGNLGHFDPELRKRNVSGLKNASKMDARVVEEFFSDWEALALRAEEIEKRLTEENDSGDHLMAGFEMREGNDIERFIKTRVNQDFFRRAVLTSYGGKCCVTGIPYNALLIASHIKPWHVSDSKLERTNPCNGLCLNALHDKAFDQGLMTVKPDYTICFSSKLKKFYNDESMNWMLQFENRKINLPERFLPNREFLEYHNDVIFVP